MPDLLLHSLESFEPLITDVLDATGARTVVEVGGEGATFTKSLVSWADRVDGEVHCVDPAPSLELERLAEAADRLRLIRELSPHALELLPRLDAYVLDGDHNHWTVSGELRVLEAALNDVERPTVVLFHDVIWPWARRDQYYAPDQLPAEGVHDHTFTGGVLPDSPGTQADGFSSAGHWGFALHEGGPRNGVLTAIEDFLADQAELELQIVPAVFGLGIMFHSGASWAERVRELVRPYQSPIVARLERNRIELYLQVLRLQGELERRARVHHLQLNAGRRGARQALD